MGYEEKAVWKMTSYKIIALFEIYKEFHPREYTQKDIEVDDIDDALRGL